MPSFFFHIALDLNSARPTSQPNLSEGKRYKPLTNTAAADLGTENRFSVSCSSNDEITSHNTTSPSLCNDWRYDKVLVQNIKMAPAPAIEKNEGELTRLVPNGLSPGRRGLATKGRYEPIGTEEEDIGWGVIRLFRDSEETPGLYREPISPKHTKQGKYATKKENEPLFRDEDCTTLCILAVPSYLTPSDFLGFVGEETRDETEHCHVVFVKSIEFRMHELPGHEPSFPDMSNDPFTPSINRDLAPSSTNPASQAVPISSSSRSAKPHAPPTPALVELPTCPSQHCFAMDMTTQRVWDYATDGYVHRIVQDKTDGKFVELTPSSAQSPHDDDFDDYVPREKLDNVGLEYTHLLSSQLDSQRMYFEEIIERAADKASQASAAAEKATETSAKIAEQLVTLQVAHDTLLNETIPAIEKDRNRATRKAEKFETMARKLEKEWKDEKAMNESLLTRVNHLGTQVDTLKAEKAELLDQNRDLGFFISGMEKLKSSGVDEKELQDGTVSLPEAAEEGKGKGKKKGGGKGKK
ncbi:BRCA1-associated protein, partial [Lecanoromycetidae sp. Uapishka_2]